MATTALQDFLDDMYSFLTRSSLVTFKAGNAFVVGNDTDPRYASVTIGQEGLDLGGSGSAFHVDAMHLDDLVGAEEFSIGFNIASDVDGRGGEVFRYGWSMVARVKWNGELMVRVATEDGVMRVTTSGASLNDMANHDVQLEYVNDQLLIRVDGDVLGGAELSGGLMRPGSQDLNFGNPRGGYNFDGHLTEFSINLDVPEDPSSPEGDVVVVSDSDGLYAALAAAKGGETILLEGGDYGEFTLTQKAGFDYRYASEVTIASADPGDPASFSGLDVRDAKNLTFDGIEFDYNYATGHPNWMRIFQFDHSDGITVRNSVFDGDVAQGVSAGEDGRGWGIGLIFRGGDDIILENNDFSEFYKALSMGGVNNAVVRDNSFHDIRMDGMNFDSMRGLLIEGNDLRDFHRATGTSDHADMIQFFAPNNGRASSDVIIRNNVLDIGNGDPTHSIFMRNEAVDRGAGIEMYYRNITIENNLIVNGHSHGITLGQTIGATVRNNSVLHSDGANVDGLDDTVEIPRIMINGASQDVAIVQNITAQVAGWSQQDGWTVAGNVIAQDQDDTEDGYYGDIFLTSTLQSDSGEHNFIVRSSELSNALVPGADANYTPSSLGLALQFHVNADPENAALYYFDARYSLLDGGAIPDGSVFEWEFSDGGIEYGAVVAHGFAEGGLHDVKLRVSTPTGQEKAMRFEMAVAGSEIMHYEAGGNFFVVEGTEDVILAEASNFDAAGIQLNATGCSFAASYQHTKYITENDDISFDFGIDAAHAGSSGEVFRLGSSLTVWVTSAGELSLRANDGESIETLVTSGAGVNDTAEHDVSIQLRNNQVSVLVDGRLVGQTDLGALAETTSQTLFIGNPWGQDNFEGHLTSFAVNQNAADFLAAPTEEEMTAGLEVFENIVPLA
ncbi:MAG: right-handed parallel beta-helix repeat-containing protein [Pseudooceanicola sp.]